MIQNLSKFFIVLIFLGFLFSNIFAQETAERKAFISLNTGCYFPTATDFNKTYGDFIFINGISLGIPIGRENLFFYAKASYFNKEGSPIITHIEFNNGVSNIYTTQQGLITISHYTFNFGFQENIKLKKNINLMVNGGFTFTRPGKHQ